MTRTIIKVSVGDVYGLWTIKDGPYNKYYWNCVCKCGINSKVYVYNLIKKRSEGCKSCTAKVPRPPKDGRRGQFKDINFKVLKKVRNAVWNAIYRCRDQTDIKYNDYGGRGIEVKFDNEDDFVRYLLTLPGHDNLELILDRIDNDGNYEPGNLRFVDYTVSNNNRRPRSCRRKIT